MSLNSPLVLPCGFKIRNRFAKSAMTECLCEPSKSDPNALLWKLYERWGRGQPGILISGNIMVDRNHREAPRNMVLDEKSSLEAYLQLTRSVKRGACDDSSPVAFIAQLSHPGRQEPLSSNFRSVAPSPIPVKIPGTPPFYANPRELKDQEIKEIVNKFVHTATLCKQVGFDGIQIHAAHGYLVSQFLSPHSNQRNDYWGGDEERRRIFLLEIIRNIRAEVGKSFIISAKLNSSDFRRGGLTEEQSMEVIKLLREAQLDFIEISGGTHESAEMMKDPTECSTEREAFFISFAQKARSVLGNQLPVMLTGGFRSVESMEWALKENWIDIVGLARPFCVEPELPKKFLSGEITTTPQYSLAFGPRSLQHLFSPLLNNYWHQQQIYRLACDKEPNLKGGYLYCLTVVFVRSYLWDWGYHPNRNLFLGTTLLMLFCSLLLKFNSFFR